MWSSPHYQQAAQCWSHGTVYIYQGAVPEYMWAIMDGVNEAVLMGGGVKFGMVFHFGKVMQGYLYEFEL